MLSQRCRGDSGWDGRSSGELGQSTPGTGDRNPYKEEVEEEEELPTITVSDSSSRLIF